MRGVASGLEIEVERHELIMADKSWFKRGDLGAV
jgi:hypothetical protein